MGLKEFVESVLMSLASSSVSSACSGIKFEHCASFTGPAGEGRKVIVVVEEFGLPPIVLELEVRIFGNWSAKLSSQWLAETAFTTAETTTAGAGAAVPGSCQ